MQDLEWDMLSAHGKIALDPTFSTKNKTKQSKTKTIQI